MCLGFYCDGKTRCLWIPWCCWSSGYGHDKCKCFNEQMYIFAPIIPCVMTYNECKSGHYSLSTLFGFQIFNNYEDEDTENWFCYCCSFKTKKSNETPVCCMGLITRCWAYQET